MAELRELPTRGLTVYLLKSGKGSEENYLNNVENLKKHELTISHTRSGVLYVQPTFPKPPRWADFFEGYIRTETVGLVSSTAAVLLLQLTANCLLLHLVMDDICWIKKVLRKGLGYE